MDQFSSLQVHLSGFHENWNVAQIWTGSDRLLVPILKNCLAHPSGICLSPDQNVIYVAETLRNRILRIIRSNHSAQVFHASVFRQLEGGLGPMGVTVDSKGNLFVAHADMQSGGRLLVLAPDGKTIASLEADQIRTILTMGPKDTCFYMAVSNLIVKTSLDLLHHE